MEKIEFTIYLDEEKTTKAFQALVATNQKYDITYDPNKLYEHLLDDVVNGNYEVEYIEYDDELNPCLNEYGLPKYQLFKIEGKEDSVENIRKFIQFQEIVGEYICDENAQPEIHPIFGVHLNGHEFGYGESMMSPAKITKVINSINKISNAAINNPDYKKYLREEAASYEVHIDATKRDSVAIELFNEIYDSIEAASLSHEKYQESSSKNIYKVILDELGNLSSSDKLSSFNVFIDGEEKPLTNLDYLHEFLANPYSDDIIEYKGKLKSPDYDKQTFQLKTVNDHIWHCHFENGSESYFNKVIDPKNLDKTLILKAYQKRAATLIVTSISVE